jgi:hypothetical protein
MPVCAGRDETGICPNNKADNTVKWSVCDLWLCADCYDYRIPSAPLLSDNTAPLNSAVTAVKTTNSNVAPVNRKLVVNEVLFYASGKYSVTTVNKLKLVLSSFFTDDEIAAAKEQLHSAVVKCNAVGVPRHVKRQGGNRLKPNVDDLVKLLTIIDEQKLMKSLPHYVAGNINRVPSVNIDDVDLFVLAKKLEAFESRLLNVEGQRCVGLTSSSASLGQTAVMTSMDPGLIVVPGQRFGNQGGLVQSPASTSSSPDHAVVTASVQPGLAWASPSEVQRVLGSTSSSASLGHTAGTTSMKPGSVAVPVHRSVCLGDQLGLVQPPESTSTPSGQAVVTTSVRSASVMVSAQQTVSLNDPDELVPRSVSSSPPPGQAVGTSSIQSGLVAVQQPVHLCAPVGLVRPPELTSVPSGPDEAVNNDCGEWQTKMPRKLRDRPRTRIHGTGTADEQQTLLKSGVDLIKKRVFHIDNLHVDTTVNDVSTFLTEHGVCVLSCYKVKSWLNRRENASVTSMRVCVRAGDSGKMLKSSLWPKSIIVRDWKFLKPIEDGRQS